MLIDLILSILSFMQGPNLDENTVHMHKLVIPPSIISDWESFLRVHVQPGDYIFTSNIRSVVNKELRRALKQLNTLLPAIVQLEGDRCERSFATQYMQNMCRRELFETVLRVLETSHDPPLVRKWINTGLYVGPESAWDLYISRLAKCLQYSVDLNENLSYDFISPIAVGRHLGMMLAGLLDIGSFMLGPVPIIEYAS